MPLDEADDDIGPVEIEVWPDAIESVEVFRLCSLEALGGMGVVWLGVTAQEIRAACALARVARSRMPQVAADVKYMAGIVAGDRNRRASAKKA